MANYAHTNYAEHSNRCNAAVVIIIVVVVVDNDDIAVVVEASVPKASHRVASTSASTLLGSVVSNLRGGEGLPKVFMFSCVEPGATPQPVFDCLRHLLTKGTQWVCGGVS